MKFAKKISALILTSFIVVSTPSFVVNAEGVSNNVPNLEVKTNIRKTISRDEAKSIMLKKVPGGKIVKLSYKHDDGIYKYKGEIIKDIYEYEIVINAYTGEILEYECDIRDDDIYEDNFDNEDQVSSGKLIGEDKAEAIMINEVPGGKIICIKIDYDDGIPFYEGKIVKGNMEYEISVNGYTGIISEFESEDRYDYSDSFPSNSNIQNNLIGEAKAKEIMLNKVSGATITKFALDLDDKIPEYKGKLVKGYREYEISVHAINGKIIDFSSEKLDDALGHWAENAIFEFYNKGYINGYSDNSFRPNAKITRAEFIKMLNSYFGLTKTSGITFNDTKHHWAKNDIDIAVTNGICQGISKYAFKPNKPITREEAAVMLANYLNIKDTNHDKLSQLQDTSNVSSWAKDAIEALLEGGYLSGTSQNLISPKSNTTRSESVTLLSRIKNK